MKNNYKLVGGLNNISTEDLIGMVHECVVFEPYLEDLVFYDNDEKYFNTHYKEPYQVLSDVCHSGYRRDDLYVKVNNCLLFSYTEDEARKELLDNIKLIERTYSKWLSIGVVEDYKHLYVKV